MLEKVEWNRIVEWAHKKVVTKALVSTNSTRWRQRRLSFSFNLQFFFATFVRWKAESEKSALTHTIAKCAIVQAKKTSKNSNVKTKERKKTHERKTMINMMEKWSKIRRNRMRFERNVKTMMKRDEKEPNQRNEMNRCALENVTEYRRLVHISQYTFVSQQMLIIYIGDFLLLFFALCLALTLVLLFSVCFCNLFFFFHAKETMMMATTKVIVSHSFRSYEKSLVILWC